MRSKNRLYTVEEDLIWRRFKESKAFRMLEEDATQEKQMLVNEWLNQEYSYYGKDKKKKVSEYIFIRFYSN